MFGVEGKVCKGVANDKEVAMKTWRDRAYIYMYMCVYKYTDMYRPVWRAVLEILKRFLENG
jgi:hypothetical protein